MPPALDAGDSALTPFARPQVELRCQTSKVAVVQLPTEQAGGIVTGESEETVVGSNSPEKQEASLSRNAIAASRSNRAYSHYSITFCQQCRVLPRSAAELSSWLLNPHMIPGNFLLHMKVPASEAAVRFGTLCMNSCPTSVFAMVWENATLQVKPLSRGHIALDQGDDLNA